MESYHSEKFDGDFSFKHNLLDFKDLNSKLLYGQHGIVFENFKMLSYDKVSCDTVIGLLASPCKVDSGFLAPAEHNTSVPNHCQITIGHVLNVLQKSIYIRRLYL